MKLRESFKARHEGRRRLRRLSLAGGALALGLSATAGLLAANVSVASATGTTYAPVPIYLGGFINAGTIYPSSHLEQAVRDAQGNYWISVYGGQGIGDLLEVNGVTRQAEAVVVLGSGFAPIDGTAANGNVYFVNSDGGPNPIIELNPTALTGGTTSSGVTTYTLAQAENAGAVTFPGSKTAFTNGVTTSGSIGVSTSSSTKGWVYVTSGSKIYSIAPISKTVTAYQTSESFDSAMTVFDGYLYAGNAANTAIYGFPLSSLTPSANGQVTPTEVITANTFADLGSNLSNLGDLSGQMVGNTPELWFLREFNGSVGYVALPSTPPVRQTTYPATEYKINTGSTVYSGYVEGMVPGRTGLWISTGAINGNQGSGPVNFYRIDPSNPGATGTGATATISPTLVPVSSYLGALSADDFALDNYNPVVLIPLTPSCPPQSLYETSIGGSNSPAPSCPVLTLAKTDNVNHATNYNATFQYFLTAGVASTSQLAEGQALNITDPLPSGMEATAASGTGWNCSSTSFPAATVNCSYSVPANGALLPGQNAPVLTLTVTAPSLGSSSVTNTATVSSSDAAPMSANDTVTLSAAPPVTSPPVTSPSVTSPSVTPTTTAPPTTTTPSTAVVAVAANSSAPPTTTTPVTKTVTVPSVHTGKPWSSEFYWVLASLSAVIGFALIVPWRRRSASTR